MTTWYITGDLGGTKMAAALVDAHGRVTQRKVLPTQAQEGFEAVTARFAGLLQEVAARMEHGRPVACGVGMPGLVDARAGRIVYAANLPGAEDYPLRRALEERLGLPVAMDNDLRLHALGESTYGAAQGCRNFLFVAVGTGVGGAFFLDGSLYRGAHGGAGEIGHIAIDPGEDAVLCTCGRRGCLEAYASGPAIEARFARRARETGLALPAAALSLREIAGWVGEPGVRGALACEVIESGGAALGRGLSVAANLYDPERILLGGGVAKSGPLWLGAVRREMARRTLYAFDEDALQAARLGEDAALCGAAVLAEEMMGDDRRRANGVGGANIVGETTKDG